MTNSNLPDFREDKAIAVAATFLKLNDGSCDKYWLNKVMYYVERQSLVKSGQPVFFDRLFSAPHGPIVSAVNDGIDLSFYPVDSGWSQYFKLEGNTVLIKEMPDITVLSPFEDELITRIAKQFKGWGFKKMRQYFHNLPENKETTSREDIDYAEILGVEGFDAETIKTILDELSHLKEVESLLNCAG